MRITVCVATKNRPEIVHQLLWSLIRQDYRSWDLVIADDSDIPVQWNSLGIYPRLFSEIARTGHEIKILRGPQVGRIGAAYQVGFKTTGDSNPLFLRVDDDCWLEPDYLSRLAEVLEDADVGACGGLFLHPGQEIETFRPDDPRYRHSRIEALSDKVNIQWFRHSETDLLPVEHLTGNILFSRKWLEKIGGFETRLYRQHRDETQATWRLGVEGAKLFVHPSAVAWHFKAINGGSRNNSPDVYLDDHRRFMAQRKTMKPGIHISLGHGIGDGLMATPMLRVMRKQNPDRDIAVYAPWAKAVLQGNPDVDEIAEQPLDAQRTIRLEESVYAWAAAAGWKGHLAAAYCKMFDVPVPDDITPRVFIGPDDFSLWPAKITHQPFVVVVPWSSAKTYDFFQPSGNKNWLVERWKVVIGWAHEHGMKVVQFRESYLEPLLDGVDVDLCQRPLSEVFACIARARLLVSVDTMAHHAAAALRIPSVVLWGRSKPAHFGYVKDHILNIQGQCPGIYVEDFSSQEALQNFPVPQVIRERPCIRGDQWAMDIEVCPIAGHPCMAGITTEMVIEAIEKLMPVRV
ncbi:MAG: glycosyltransferase [Desulfomonile sp.]